MDDQEFDKFLKTRHVPEAPSNLATRIVDESARMTRGTQKVSLGERLFKGLNRFLDGFAIPQPALALGAVLFLVVGLGVLGTDINITTAPNVSVEAQDFSDVSLAFYVDDLLGADDYL